jgi:hypothetical protein
MPPSHARVNNEIARSGMAETPSSPDRYRAPSRSQSVSLPAAQAFSDTGNRSDCGCATEVLTIIATVVRVKPIDRSRSGATVSSLSVVAVQLQRGETCNSTQISTLVRCNQIMPNLGSSSTTSGDERIVNSKFVDQRLSNGREMTRLPSPNDAARRSRTLPRQFKDALGAAVRSDR